MDVSRASEDGMVCFPHVSSKESVIHKLQARLGLHGSWTLILEALPVKSHALRLA